MSEINHSRPSLRWLDNMRRELSHYPSAPLTRAGRPAAAVFRLGTKTYPRRSEVSFRRHMDRLDQMSGVQRTVIGRMIETYILLVEARASEVESLSGPGNRGKRTAAREIAQQKTLVTCAAFNAHCDAEEATGLSATREWYRKLLTVLGSDRQYWSELEEVMKQVRGKR